MPDGRTLGAGGPYQPSRPGHSSLSELGWRALTDAVSNPQSATQDWTLADLPTGTTAWVVSVDPGVGPALTSHGIRPGATVEVELDAPFGGPRIVRLGFARLAIARSVARAIRVKLGSMDVSEEPR